MKAQEMSRYVYEVERALQADIAEIVKRHLDDITQTTGLEVCGVSINLIDVRNLASAGPEYAVGLVQIDHRLPDKVWT